MCGVLEGGSKVRRVLVCRLRGMRRCRCQLRGNRVARVQGVEHGGTIRYDTRKNMINNNDMMDTIV